MSNLTGQRIILTGASGGIGQELVKQLFSYDCKLGLVGRSLEGLEKFMVLLKTPDISALLRQISRKLKGGRQ